MSVLPFSNCVVDAAMVYAATGGIFEQLLSQL